MQAMFTMPCEVDDANDARRMHAVPGSRTADRRAQGGEPNAAVVVRPQESQRRRSFN